MDDLKLWIVATDQEHRIEPNSGFGKALAYYPIGRVRLPPPGTNLGRARLAGVLRGGPGPR
ncbi:MAG: hypothetical protein JW751_07255 [Polyangiaceae bacterium]|nr:hypothetical protein [Polyangiaceae bacterium]